VNLFFFFRWQIFDRVCHLEFTFLFQMVNFRPEVPSQTHFSFPDGKFPARRAIAKLAFLNLMANPLSGVPSRTYLSQFDGKLQLRCAIANPPCNI
jgi:hypothetical protein